VIGWWWPYVVAVINFGCGYWFAHSEPSRTRMLLKWQIRRDLDSEYTRMLAESETYLMVYQDSRDERAYKLSMNLNQELLGMLRARQIVKDLR